MFYPKTLRVFNRSYKLAAAQFTAIRKQSNFEKQYNLSLEKPEEFWGPKADLIEWFKKPTKIFDPNISPFEKWYLLLKTLCNYHY